MSTRSGSERNEIVDALKFFAMGTVVMMHEFNLVPAFKHLPHASTVVDVLWSFAMPLFALLSGFVLWGREGHAPLRFIWRKGLALVVPYLAWIAIELPVRHFVFGMKGYQPAEWVPRLGLSLVDVGKGMQMWFLIALFWVFVLFVLARLVSRSQWWMGASALAVALVPLVWTTVPWTVSKVCWLYLFFIAGYLVAAHRERFERIEMPIAAAGMLSFPLLLAADQRFLSVALAFAGIAASWGVYRMLPAAALAPQARWGRLSLGIYGAQMVVLPFLVFGEGYVGVALSWTATMVVTVVVSLVLERWTPTRAVLLGQWPRPSRPKA